MKRTRKITFKLTIDRGQECATQFLTKLLYDSILRYCLHSQIIIKKMSIDNNYNNGVLKVKCDHVAYMGLCVELNKMKYPIRLNQLF